MHLVHEMFYAMNRNLKSKLKEKDHMVGTTKGPYGELDIEAV